MKRLQYAEDKTRGAAKSNPPKPVTDEQWEKIARMLRVGGSLENAAAFAKISLPRLHRNLASDKKFSRRVDEAMAKCTFHHLKKIYDGKRMWQASAWFVERIERKRFGAKVEVVETAEKAIQMRKVDRLVGRRPEVTPSEN